MRIIPSVHTIQSRGELIGICAFAIFIFISGVAVPCTILFFRHNKINKRALLSFILFTSVILLLTLFSRDSSVENTEFRGDILAPIKDYVRYGDNSYLIHWMLNAILFVPSGFSFTKSFKGAKHRLLMSAGIGCLLSTSIELLQYFLFLGQCDINDITANTFGTWFGAVFGIMKERFCNHESVR